MKRLLKKSRKIYKSKSRLTEEENTQQVEKIDNNETELDNEEGIEPFTDIVREDPYLGRYVEITNRRSKYYGYHARVDDKFYSNRYKIYIEPKRIDDDGGKGYIVNFVDVHVAHKWFTVIE